MRAKQTFLLAAVLVTLIAGMPPPNYLMANAQDTAQCPEAPPTRLVVGAWGQVTPGSPNNVRIRPDIQSEMVGQLPGEELFKVLDGPADPSLMTCLKSVSFSTAGHNEHERQQDFVKEFLGKVRTSLASSSD